MKKAIPWGTVGFLAGAALGFAWGQKAKSRIGESVTTDFNGGVLSIRVNTIDAAKAGLPDILNSYIEKARG